MAIIDNKALTLKDGRTFILRNVQVEDAQEMLDFVDQTDQESLYLTREPGEALYTLESEQKIIAQTYDDPYSCWIAAALDGKMIGNCHVRAVSSRKRLRHRADFGISVLKAYWGLGVGTLLLQAAIDWCKAQGFEQLELSVVAENKRGLALYEKLGFEVTGTVRNAHKNVDGSYMDTLHMWKRLL